MFSKPLGSFMHEATDFCTDLALTNVSSRFLVKLLYFSVPVPGYKAQLSMSSIASLQIPVMLVVGPKTSI